jgi:hypothetical protein
MTNRIYKCFFIPIPMMKKYNVEDTHYDYGNEVSNRKWGRLPIGQVASISVSSRLLLPNRHS